MDDFTVADIVQGRSSLRERARAAWRDEKARQKREYDADVVNLREEAQRFLSETLQVTEAELADANFIVRPMAGKHPSRPSLEITIDRIAFRCFYETKLIMTVSTSEFEEKEKVYDKVFTFQLITGRSAATEIKSLQELGKLLP